MKWRYLITSRAVTAVVATLALTYATSLRARSNEFDATVAGHNLFALDLYRNLAIKNDDNLIFSPLSVSTALSMVLAGANSSTADEMNAALHVTLPSQQYHAAVGGSLGVLSAPSSEFQLAIANRLWAQQGFPIYDSYLDLTRGQYGAPLKSLDFFGATEAARQTINDWVEEQTHDKIRDLIPQGALQSNTALVLTNAIYFKGKWGRPFNAETLVAPFSLASGQQRSVTMMQQTGYLRHSATADFDMLELPYQGNAQSLLLLLPRAADGLAALEASLTTDLLDRTVNQLQRTYVLARVPKFKLETMLNLNSALGDLGISELFTAGADLSGISPASLIIDKALHKAIIEIDTEGTTAAAATAIIGITTTCYCPPPTPMLFNADHPFLFALRDNRTDSILFMGRLTAPEVAAPTDLQKPPFIPVVGDVPAVPEPATGVLSIAALAITTAAFVRRSFERHKRSFRMKKSTGPRAG